MGKRGRRRRGKKKVYHIWLGCVVMGMGGNMGISLSFSPKKLKARYCQKKVDKYTHLEKTCTNIKHKIFSLRLKICY